MPVLGDAGVVSPILNCILKLTSATNNAGICSRFVLRAAELDPRGHKRAVDAHRLLRSRDRRLEGAKIHDERDRNRGLHGAVRTLGGAAYSSRAAAPSVLTKENTTGARARAPCAAYYSWAAPRVTTQENQCCDFGIGPTLDHAVQGRSNVAQRGPRSPILWRARVVQGQFWKGWTWSKVGSSVA